jgi:hypothetical protein
VLRDDGAAGGGGGFGNRIGWAADPKSSTTRDRDGAGREPISGDTGYIEKVRVRLRLCGAGALSLAFGAALPCGPRAVQPSPLRVAPPCPRPRSTKIAQGWPKLQDLAQRFD